LIKSYGLEVSQLPLREKRNMYLLMLMHEKLPTKSLRKYTRFVAVLKSSAIFSIIRIRGAV